MPVEGGGLMNLFTEPQWRAIARVEELTESAGAHDGFHIWCERKRLFGGGFDCGEFYLGWHVDDFRVFERPSGIDLSYASDKAGALAEARRNLLNIGPYWAQMVPAWTERNAALIAERENTRAEIEARDVIRKARADAKANRKIPRRRQAIFNASGGLCHYCGCGIELRGDWHVEHKMPKALGGSDEPINLVAACAPCNREKKDKTDLEYLALRASRGDSVRQQSPSPSTN